MTLIQTFHGNATNGTELTAVYAEQPAANVAFALVFPGNDLPRLVHWGRPLAAPATVIDMFDAQMPQRVSGALDYTSWPSVLPTQSESWIGAKRFEIRRDGRELFCKFAVTDIKAETFLMDSLNAPARTPFIFLALSGVVMIVALTVFQKRNAENFD